MDQGEQVLTDKLHGEVAIQTRTGSPPSKRDTKAGTGPLVPDWAGGGTELHLCSAGRPLQNNLTS